MNFNFKLVYTDVVYNVEISSHETVHELFNVACEQFKKYIDYNKYYIEWVVCGQTKSELAPSVSEHNYDHPLYYEFGHNWKSVSFYVRPVNRMTDRFVRPETDIYIQIEPTAEPTIQDDPSQPVDQTQPADTSQPVQV
jgi:hypothetical protein